VTIKYTYGRRRGFCFRCFGFLFCWWYDSRRLDVRRWWLALTFVLFPIL